MHTATAMKASSVPAFASSAISSRRKKPAMPATKIPVTSVINTGEPVRADTLLNARGSSPSRAITKKMRLWPYIITRITEGNATSAASPMSFAASGWWSVSITKASGALESPTSVWLTEPTAAIATSM